MSRFVAVIRGVLVFSLFLSAAFLLNACSESITGQPDASGSVASAEIGPEGGELRFDGDCVLLVPPGAVGAAGRFSIREATQVPPPPDGCRRFGPAYLIAGPALEASLPAGVAIRPAYDPLNDPENLMYLPARLSRLDGDNRWSTVPDSGSPFGLFLNGCTDALGTFAVHVDTTTGQVGEVQAYVKLGMRAVWSDGATQPTWSSTAVAQFYDPVLMDPRVEAGGDLRIGALTLTPYGPGFIATSQRPEFEAGESYRLQVPGGAEVPALDIDLKYLNEAPVLTSPVAPGTEVSRATGFTVTWEGTGPGFTWLLVYGTGREGFVSFGGATANDGEFVVTPEDLAPFDPGAQLTVYLQQLRLRSLAGTGFTANSTYSVEVNSVAHVVVR
ncbi:MAG: hypothetical protein IPP62_13415 [bacterium]|nr:hypothetical protein [bacterium]